MLNLEAKLAGTGLLMVDLCSGKMDVKKTCLLFSEPRRFFGCQKDEGCVNEALSGLVHVYTKQLLSFERDSTTNEEIKDAARVLLAKVEGIQVQRKEGIWREPIELQPVQ